MNIIEKIKCLFKRVKKLETESTAYATSAQGTLADTAVQPADLNALVESYLLSLPGAIAGNILTVNATGDGFEWVAP